MNEVLYGYHPQIFDMDEDLEYELEAKPLTLTEAHGHPKLEQQEVDNISPRGIHELDSPFLEVKKPVESNIIYDESPQFSFVNTLEEQLFQKKQEFILPHDGFFEIQKTSSISLKESMLSPVARNFEPYDFKKQHFFQVHRILFKNVLNIINAPCMHRYLWSEVMEELFYYTIHHQIKAYRQAYDQVLDELVFDGFGEPDSGEPGFPGFSRTSSPQI